MPRPPTKRNRHMLKAAPTSSEETSRPKPDNEIVQNVANSPKANTQGTGNTLQVAAQHCEIVQQFKNQTPVAKSHEQAIESSPMGERGATGSRPPTRSRGYSSSLSIAGRKGDMSSKIPGTPVFESSVLSNFRRRPRQPSILQMMQAEDRSSDLDDDDFLGGLSPEDESTPLHLSRGKSITTNAPSPSPSQAPLPSSGSSRKRNRSVDEVQVPQSSLAVAEDSLPGSPNLEIDEDVALDNGISPDTPQRPKFLENSAQTMAPPISSPPCSPYRLIPKPDSVKRPKPPGNGDNELQKHSKSDKVCLSTARLQEQLLPRRHQRQSKRRYVSTFEGPNETSEDDGLLSESDQDELSYLPSQRALSSQRKGSVKPKPSSGVGRSKANQRTITSINGDATGVKKTTNDPAKAKGVRESLDYIEFDKENEAVDISSPLSSPLDTDAFETDSGSEILSPTLYMSEELRLQAKKFAEVDEWQMEFEDVPGSPGSMFR